MSSLDRSRTRVARARTLASMAVLVAVVAGCGSTASQPAPSTEPVPIHSSDAPVPGAEAPTTVGADACHGVARGAVERHLAGRVVREQVAAGPLGATRCTFVLAATNVGRSGVVAVTFDAHGSPAAFARTRSSFPAARSVPHVGDHAFYVADLRLLQMIVGRSVISLRASVATPATPLKHPALLRDDLTALARDIAAAH